MTKKNKIMSEIKTTAQTANVNKETANVNANLFLLSSLDKSLFVSNSGQNKETIYKSDLFKNLSDKEKKSLRRKLRNTIDSFITSFIAYDTAKDTKKLNALFVSFNDYYKSVYVLNDYSLNSLISNNTDVAKKDGLTKMLSIVNKLIKK